MGVHPARGCSRIGEPRADRCGDVTGEPVGLDRGCFTRRRGQLVAGVAVSNRLSYPSGCICACLHGEEGTIPNRGHGLQPRSRRAKMCKVTSKSVVWFPCIYPCAPAEDTHILVCMWACWPRHQDACKIHLHPGVTPPCYCTRPIWCFLRCVGSWVYAIIRAKGRGGLLPEVGDVT